MKIKKCLPAEALAKAGKLKIVIPILAILFFVFSPAFYIRSKGVKGLPQALANRAAIGSEMEDVFLQLAGLEESYFAEYGKYFQGLPTKDVTFSGESATSFDAELKPADQPKNWRDFGFNPGAALVSYAIDVYDGPAGKGYTLKASFERNGVSYTFSRHNGPENERNISTNEWVSSEGDAFLSEPEPPQSGDDAAPEKSSVGDNGTGAGQATPIDNESGTTNTSTESGTGNELSNTASESGEVIVESPMPSPSSEVTPESSPEITPTPTPEPEPIEEGI